jgi:hypothetical protein
MDRKPERTRFLKSGSNPKRRSAFEMSLSLEFQVAPPQKGVAIPKAGDLCPQCQSAKVDYDGMLNLSCPDCGYTLAGCFT